MSPEFILSLTLGVQPPTVGVREVWRWGGRENPVRAERRRRRKLLARSVAQSPRRPLHAVLGILILDIKT